jgi:hypothetical protein
VSHNGLLITWPKTRPLSSYLDELAKAKERGHTIHYRVSRLPLLDYGAPVYHVHDGAIRGWCASLGYSDGTGVIDPITGEPWPIGNYIVRSPEWHPIDPITYAGFRGWRYYVPPSAG